MDRHRRPDDVANLAESLVGLKCSHVSCGGAAGSTIQLHLGEVVGRLIPAKEPRITGDILRYEGGVVVWCAWRLDSSSEPLTSWDDSDESIEGKLTKLIGTVIESVELVPPAWDANIRFSGDRVLRIFSDHVPGDPSFSGNWDLRVGDFICAFGPGARYSIEETRMEIAPVGESSTV